MTRERMTLVHHQSSPARASWPRWRGLTNVRPSALLAASLSDCGLVDGEVHCLSRRVARKAGTTGEGAATFLECCKGRRIGDVLIAAHRLEVRSIPAGYRFGVWEILLRRGERTVWRIARPDRLDCRDVEVRAAEPGVAQPVATQKVSGD